jgi:tetratricopeptide (TPR) repeat protein
MFQLGRLPALASLVVFGLLAIAGPAAADDRATCSEASGDVAIAACTRAIETGASQPAAIYRDRAVAYYRKGDYERAIADASEAIRIDPQFGKAYRTRGAAYSAKGNKDRALADWNEAIRIDPGDATSYNNRALAYKARGDQDRAVADFNEALRINPEYANGYLSRGNFYREKGDNDRAIADYNEAIRIDPKYTAAFQNRGNAYYNKGETDRAIADYDEAIRIDPKYTAAYNGRGNAYYKKGETYRAIADYGEAIRIDPKNTYAYNGRGNAYYKTGDNDRAIADYGEAIRIDPKFAMGYSNRANAYARKDDNDRAIADLNEAIRLNPKYAQAHTSRGIAYQKTGNVAKARADFEAVLAMPKDPANPWPHDTARTRVANLPSSPNPIAVRPTDRRIALVIGNSAYDSVPALANPERDARLVGDVLQRTGFQSVTLLTNLKKDALIGALRSFAEQAETADWAVIYYAGHGMEVAGTNYLIPVDARVAADRDISFEAVPIEQVLNAADRAKKLRLVILDACRDNPFKVKMKRTLTVASRSVASGLAAVEPEAGTLVVFAAKDGQQALDGDGINSPFAQAFVNNVQTPGLEVRRLFDYVRDDVLDMTSRQQQPFSYGSISGRQDFYFVAAK